MKKIYTKPMLAVERYELTQTVATCNTYKIGLNSNTCVLNDPDSPDPMKNLAYIGFFLEGHCDIFSKNMSENDGICYHTSVNAAFNS